MSTTDIHGKIWEEYLESGKPEKNTMLAASTAVSKVRDKFADKTVLFDNGDLYQGSIISTLDIPQKYSDIDTVINPTTQCMLHMKYDGFTLGNHEFNYAFSQMSLNYDILEKYGTQLVCANIYYRGNNERVFKPYMTKTLDVDGTQVKVGIIGLENTDVPRWDTVGNYNSWMFHSKENPNADISYEIKKAKEEMIANGDNCDFTIVSYHGGFFPDSPEKESLLDNYEEKLEKKLNEPVELFKNSESQGYRAVRNSSGIDMFILGHDHVNVYSNKQFKNADGMDVLVVNGAKKDLTQSVFEVVKKDGLQKPEIKLVDSENCEFSKYEADSNLKNKIRPYAESVSRVLDVNVARVRGNWGMDNNTDDSYFRQTDSVDLINRAQIWYGKKFLTRKFANNAEINKFIKFWKPYYINLRFDENEPIDVDISCASAASAYVPDKDEAYFSQNEMSTLYPFDNEITFCPVSGQMIKNLIEFNASDRYSVKVDENGNKKIVTIKDKYTCPIFYGINFVYDMTKEPGNRAQIEGFSNGKPFDLNKTYCLALNNYFLGNFSNKYLGELDSDDELIDKATDGPRELCRNALIQYAKECDKLDGGLYPTNECQKNRENPSHWSFKY